MSGMTWPSTALSNTVSALLRLLGGDVTHTISSKTTGEDHLLAFDYNAAKHKCE
jgi:hypothetical protein